jgi:hypothetical protein
MTAFMWDKTKIQTRLQRDANYIAVDQAVVAMLEMQGEYETDNALLRAQLLSQTARILELTTETESLTKTIAMRDTTISEQIAQIADLEKQLSDQAVRIADLTAHNDALYDDLLDMEKQIFRLQHPADVYVTVDTSQSRTNHLQQGLAVVTNEFFPAAAAATVERMTPYIHDLYDQVSYHLSGGFGVVDAWEWNPANGPRPVKPTNLASLRNMAGLVNKFGRPHLLTLYRPSWHMKRQRGRALTYAEAWGPGSAETGRLSGEFKADWQLMVNELCYTAATEILKVDVNANIDCEIHNEFKGMWELLNKDVVLKNQNWADGENPGTSGYGDIDYGPYYALTVQAAIAGFARAKIGRERIRFGGPYAVLQSRGTRTANALPVGHPLADRPWGHMSKMPIYAIERFLVYIKKYNLPLDYLVVDGGTHNNDDVFITDVWGQLMKIDEANTYLRYLLDQAGLVNVPIWWAERYLTERPAPDTATITAYQDSMARRAVVTLAGLATMAWSGAGKIFQWGLRGEDGDPTLNRENAAYFKADGTPTMLYDALLKFKQLFPVGGNLYPLVFEGEGVGGLGSDVGALIYNKTDTAKTVCLRDTVYLLEASKWLVIPF